MQRATVDRHTVRPVDWHGANGGPGRPGAAGCGDFTLAAHVGHARGFSGDAAHLVL